MKRVDLLRTIGRAARRAGSQWVLGRQGREHEIWSLDGQQIPIPRHREVHELTAKRILKDLERRFGEGWWRR